MYTYPLITVYTCVITRGMRVIYNFYGVRFEAEDDRDKLWISSFIGGVDDDLSKSVLVEIDNMDDSYRHHTLSDLKKKDNWKDYIYKSIEIDNDL